jgi:hypothetical protein
MYISACTTAWLGYGYRRYVFEHSGLIVSHLIFARADQVSSHSITFTTVAGYGLSAFLYATISALLIGDNTDLFLLVLATGTFLSLFIAGLMLTKERMSLAYELVPGGLTLASPSSNSTALRRSRSRSVSRSTASVGDAGEDDDIEHHNESGIVFEVTEDDDEALLQGGRGGAQVPSSTSPLYTPLRASRHKPRSSILIKQSLEGKDVPSHGDIQGVETSSLGLFRIPDYYILMIVAFACTGTGIMWINSVGTVVGESYPCRSILKSGK